MAAHVAHSAAVTYRYLTCVPVVRDHVPIPLQPAVPLHPRQHPQAVSAFGVNTLLEPPDASLNLRR